MKWAFLGMSAFSMVAATVQVGYDGPPGWLRMVAALLSLAFASASVAIWIMELEKKQP